MNFVVPTKLETSRLILRTFEDKDWHDMSCLYADEEVIQFTIKRTLDKAESWRTMTMLAGHWLMRGYGPYALEEKETGTVMGYTGLWFPGEWPEPEIAWGLARPFWGKGFASEAAIAVKKMAKEHVPEMKLISLIDKNNHRSIKLAESLGARFEKEITFKDNLCCIYRHSVEP